MKIAKLSAIHGHQMMYAELDRFVLPSCDLINQVNDTYYQGQHAAPKLSYHSQRERYNVYFADSMAYKLCPHSMNA